MRLIALALFLVSLESLGQVSVPNLLSVGQVGGAMNQRSSQIKSPDELSCSSSKSGGACGGATPAGTTYATTAFLGWK
jgi:hypothetical protein